MQSLRCSCEHRRPSLLRLFPAPDVAFVRCDVGKNAGIQCVAAFVHFCLREQLVVGLQLMQDNLGRSQNVDSTFLEVGV